eukprot:7278332-Alexandrium_andersonii.AAC.1
MSQSVPATRRGSVTGVETPPIPPSVGDTAGEPAPSESSRGTVSISSEALTRALDEAKRRRVESVIGAATMDADDTEYYGDGMSDDEEEMVEGFPAALLHEAKQKELQRLPDFGVYE